MKLLLLTLFVILLASGINTRTLSKQKTMSAKHRHGKNLLKHPNGGGNGGQGQGQGQGQGPQIDWDDAEEVFNAIDKNGDGAISFQEAKKFFKKVDPEFDEEDAKDLEEDFDEADTDGDGFVDLPEFEAVWESD